MDHDPAYLAYGLERARFALSALLAATRAGHPLRTLVDLQELACGAVAVAWRCVHLVEHPDLAPGIGEPHGASVRLRLLRALVQRLEPERIGGRPLRPLDDRDLDDAVDYLEMLAAQAREGRAAA